MSGAGEEGDDLSDDLVGVSSYEAPGRVKRKFEGWHRPRKQYVREKQWCAQIDTLLDELNDATELRYFGLPGSDLLDLRCFHKKVCEPRGLRLRYMGFNKGADPGSPDLAEMTISIDEIQKLSNVDPGSLILPDDFRLLASDESLAWQRTAELGPYDVINLDLCDGFGKDHGSEFNNTYYTAVSHLMTLQSRRAKPWLLLLTTRVGQEHVHKDTFDALKKNYTSNLTSCVPFREASNAHFAINDVTSLKLQVLTAKGLQSVFLTSICKWLVALGLAFKPASKVEIASVMGYKVKPQATTEDMVSIAIKVIPTLVAPKDPGNLAKQPVKALDECSLASAALEEIRKLCDVDSTLAGDAVLACQMLENMGGLLEQARYDLAEYKKWAAKH